MPKLPVINFLRQSRKSSIPSNLLKAGPPLNFREGEQIVVTYTPTTDKMKLFSAFIGEGLENAGAAWYLYPDEESETVRAKLKEHGIDVEKYEKDDTLHMESLAEHFESNGKLDYEKAVVNALKWWTWAKDKGYKSIRDIEDFGDFSFVNGQWQKWMTDYWLDPRWEDPNVSEWVVVKGTVGVVYIPLIMSITAVNVERMAKKEVDELLKAFGGTKFSLKRFFIDLLEYKDSFSRSMGLDHELLVGRKILFEFDSLSNYEKVVDDLAKESMANVEPIFAFTSRASPIHTHLGEQPTVKFFLTSISASTPEAISENEVLLPVNNTPLMLEAISKVLETYAKINVCFVFDILSELLTSVGQEKTFSFLYDVLDMLFSKKITGLFLLNTGSHEPEVVSQIRGLFGNQLTYDKYGFKVTKIFPSLEINTTE